MTAPKLVACGRTLLLAAALAISAGANAFAQSFDVMSLPRPEGAQVAPDREASSSSITYVYPANVSNTVAATEKALNGSGWLRYRTPDQESSSSSLRFKNGRTGIYVSFTMSGGKADQSRLYYSHNNSIPANVPFPEDATDIVYDENRPYLRCVTGMSVDATLEYFTKGLSSEGWSPFAAAAIAAQYPNAKLNDAIDGGQRAYFNRERRERQYPPVALTLQRAADGRTVVDLRTASFALPQELEFHQEYAGLPAAKNFKSNGAAGRADLPRREAQALLIAEIPAVVAFYRREMTLRSWAEQPGASISDSSAKLTFTKPDETAVLELGRRYDLTTVRLNAQISPAAMAARERAKKEADAQWMNNAVKQAQELAAASEAKRRERDAVAAAAPVETLKPLANSPAPIPMPEDAIEVKFDGNRGDLEFRSPSSPKSVAAFYRDALKSRGWQEGRSVINGPSMFRMDFSKGGQKIGMTVMQMGPNAKISADGNGLEVAADPTKETVRLEGDDQDGFPVPKDYSMSSKGGVTKMGGGPAFRREFDGKVPADLGSVLAFYRRELAKRSWKEQTDGAVVQPDNVRIAFAAPDGPAWLKLGRDGRETTINIVVKNPIEAAKADALPPAGMGRVVLGNMGDAAVSVTINQKTIRVPPGVSKERPPKELMLDLKPGKYRYVVKVAGKRDATDEVTVAADDTWALLIGPGGGVLPLQMY